MQTASVGEGGPMTTLETLSIVFAVYAIVFLAHRATNVTS
jgi:hypothetical protein